MKLFKRITLIVFILIIGATAGAYTTHTIIMKKISFITGGPSIEHLPKITQHLGKRLDLNEKQKEEVTKIITLGITEMQQVRDEYHPYMRQIREKTNNLILEKLNEKQRQKFNVIRERMEKRIPFT